MAAVSGKVLKPHKRRPWRNGPPAPASAAAPRGRAPKPPAPPGPRPTDQYNFTDPDSRIMKQATNAGFAPAYNAQTLVDQASLLIVG